MSTLLEDFVEFLNLVGRYVRSDRGYGKVTQLLASRVVGYRIGASEKVRVWLCSVCFEFPPDRSIRRLPCRDMRKEIEK